MIRFLRSFTVLNQVVKRDLDKNSNCKGEKISYLLRLCEYKYCLEDANTRLFAPVHYDWDAQGVAQERRHLFDFLI